MRKSARTQIPPFFDNDPYIYNYCHVFHHVSQRQRLQNFNCENVLFFSHRASKNSILLVSLSISNFARSLTLAADRKATIKC